MGDIDYAYSLPGLSGGLVREALSVPFDENEGPKVVFADAQQTIQLADMSGDGLVDIVRIRNGAVCYWPNLGYGRFGAKVTLENSPVFAPADEFHATRVRLSDIDGSGTTDLIYLVSRHRYRHGFFDGFEREFRGFARVDQFDAEDFAAPGSDPLLYQAPVHALSVFDLGASGQEGQQRTLSARVPL